MIPDVQYSTVQYSRVQYGTVQYSIVQYSMVQYSTVQYSMEQYSTESRLLFYHGKQVCKGSKDQKVESGVAQSVNVTYFGVEIAGARVQDSALSSLVLV